MLRIRFGRRAGAVKRVCRGCEARRAIFRGRGIATWDPYRTLCVQCYRRHADRLRACPGSEAPATVDAAPADRAAVA